MTFEELLETDKLLNKDILKLKNISMSQKKKLIVVHNMKKIELITVFKSIQYSSFTNKK